MVTEVLKDIKEKEVYNKRPQPWEDILDEIYGDPFYDASSKPGVLYWHGFPVQGTTPLRLMQLEKSGKQHLIGRYLKISRGVNKVEETWKKDCK